MTTMRRAVRCRSVGLRSLAFPLACAVPAMAMTRLPIVVWFMAVLVRVRTKQILSSVYGRSDRVSRCRWPGSDPACGERPHVLVHYPVTKLLANTARKQEHERSEPD